MKHLKAIKCQSVFNRKELMKRVILVTKSSKKKNDWKAIQTQVHAQPAHAKSKESRMINHILNFLSELNLTFFKRYN